MRCYPRYLAHQQAAQRMLLHYHRAKSYTRGDSDVASLMSYGFVCNNSLPELADNDTLYAWEKDNLRIYTENGKITKPTIRLDKAE